MDPELMNVKIAVDFDGTIVEHEYPAIGKVKLFAFETLKALQKKGFRLILWTFRTGKELEEAVEFCRKNGVEFYAVNKNYPEEVFDEETVSRKIDADIYIDDKNVGGFPGWSKVWELIIPDEMEERNKMFEKRSKKRFFSGLFGRKTVRMILSVFFLAGLSGISFVPAGCKGKDTSVKNRGKVVVAKEEPAGRVKKKITFIRPKEVITFQTGQPVVYELTAGDSLEVPDSVVILVDDNRLAVYHIFHIKGTWNTAHATVGVHSLRAAAYYEGGKTRHKTIHITLTSDFIPREYTYRVVKVYPHDRGAYTQGLVYDEGYIYEGTGLRGSSTLRKWELNTGRVIQSLNLSPDLFGEGICLLDDHIYQLTWTSRVGFVYDKESFSLINKIHYNTQGWGLTTDGKNLIMSDGSNSLYFLDPKYFTILKKVEVYDDRGPVNQLNELEYIDSTVYANVYQTDDIVQIDPSCGKVLARMHLRGILPKKEYRSDTDVLNGIAWDPVGKRIFVTGKKWPELFQVQFIPVH